ncbi:MAG: hypothetical protein COS08_04845 [Euryarchaeota archaeon CG01_land_8_20_14_3_00_38_12]|nr:MAG: hypothetical protein COS08_04845 [Euryarchaeota archaeon CG01_land_8_20_14_3_00_38_12]PJB21968.1 MAG: hypothetical protein CO114_02525 [Euryarchaeota archaeon CG_4_9_14_3_um_filter_38_12]
MGRQYVFIKLCNKERCVKNVKALIDTGSDLTIISSNTAKQLGYTPNSKMREWMASDKEPQLSPIFEEISLELGKPYTAKEKIEYVVVDDKPLDISEGEDMVIGLDFIQKVGMNIRVKRE